MQGGEIGVASEAGVGSTFAFYVKARRSTAPADDKVIHTKGAAVSAKGTLTSPAVASVNADKEEPIKVLVSVSLHISGSTSSDTV